MTEAELNELRWIAKNAAAAPFVPRAALRELLAVYDAADTVMRELDNPGPADLGDLEAAVLMARPERDDGIPASCTEAAERLGCTCTRRFAHSTSLEPPEPK